MQNFYPRSPCGERLHVPAVVSPLHDISIHALLAESDVSFMVYDTTVLIFLSTLSLRRATWQRGSRITYVEISIHALLAESDSCTPHSRRSQKISIHALLAESDINRNIANSKR